MPSPYQMFVRCRTPRQRSAAARSATFRDASWAWALGRFLGPIAFALSVLAVVACSVESDCENEACICAEGATCDFNCVAPPCHVECRKNSDCTGQCANGACKCASDSACSFGCGAPPCHVDCSSHTDCEGTCANGNCSCGSDATCNFECQSGPCHVDCGARSKCTGECSNGTCDCGTDGRCEFTCKDGNCKTRCPSGAQCLLTCNGGGACKFDTCAGGVTECADGRLACNRPCP